MPTPLLLIVAPLLAALIIFLALSRWPRAAGICGFLSALLIALLLAAADLQPVDQTSAPFSGEQLSFLGRSLLITEGLRRVLLLVYAGAALLFLLSSLWSQGPGFVPAALAALSPLSFALMVTPLAFGAVALLLAAALLASLVQGQRPGSTLASLRYLILTALAVPPLLVAGWMIDSQQFALGGVIWRLLLLGATLLLAAFPFHIWVRPLLVESRPLTAVFILGPVQLGIVTFVWRWLQQNSDLLLTTQLGVYLGWSGAATALVAAILAYGARDPRRLLGAVVLADIGATLICLAQGVAGIEQAWSLLLLRFLALLLAAIGLQWAAQRAAVGDDRLALEHLARRPLAAALFAYGAASLIGLPLTAGFTARWAAIALGGATSPWWALFMLLAVAGGVAGLVRVMGPVAERLRNQADRPLSSYLPGRLPLALIAVATLLALVLSLYPWPLLSLVSNLNELF